MVDVVHIYALDARPDVEVLGTCSGAQRLTGRTSTSRALEVTRTLVVGRADHAGTQSAPRRRHHEAEAERLEGLHAVETEAAGGGLGSLEIRVELALGLLGAESLGRAAATGTSSVRRDPILVHPSIVARLGPTRGRTLGATLSERDLGGSKWLRRPSVPPDLAERRSFGESTPPRCP
jgi:hypothetical protein